VKVYDRAVGLCEEFTDYVLVDRTRHSIIVNIDVEYFRTVKKELERLGYTLVFTKKMETNETITLTFTL
jgi:predicted RNA-binding protein with PIN domain